MYAQQLNGSLRNGLPGLPIAVALHKNALGPLQPTRAETHMIPHILVGIRAYIPQGVPQNFTLNTMDKPKNTSN